MNRGDARHPAMRCGIEIRRHKTRRTQRIPVFFVIFVPFVVHRPSNVLSRYQAARGAARRLACSLRLAVGHLDPVQLLLDLVKGVVADLVGGAHRENSLPGCLEDSAMKIAV